MQDDEKKKEFSFDESDDEGGDAGDVGEGGDCTELEF